MRCMTEKFEGHEKFEQSLRSKFEGHTKFEKFEGQVFILALRTTIRPTLTAAVTSPRNNKSFRRRRAEPCRRTCRFRVTSSRWLSAGRIAAGAEAVGVTDLSLLVFRLRRPVVARLSGHDFSVGHNFTTQSSKITNHFKISVSPIGHHTLRKLVTCHDGRCIG
jgi:hypothetical protein